MRYRDKLVDAFWQGVNNEIASYPMWLRWTYICVVIGASALTIIIEKGMLK